MNDLSEVADSTAVWIARRLPGCELVREIEG